MEKTNEIYLEQYKLHMEMKKKKKNHLKLNLTAV
jgi:hypothetical protein